MLVEERLREILRRVRDSGGVRVAVLASELHVTPETIRRDLERLDNDGKLIRTHGGAVPVASDRRELPFDVRESANPTQKRLIALAAVKHIVEGDVIALDASSTARELARVMPDMSLTIVTHSLAVASELVDRAHIRVISTGGVLDAPSLSFVGSMAEQILARFHVKKLFFSCQGLDIERGLSLTADEQAGMKRRMLDLAEAAYLLADSTKFGVKAVEFFANCDELDVVITDKPVPQPILTALTGLKVSVEVAEHAADRGQAGEFGVEAKPGLTRVGVQAD